MGIATTVGSGSRRHVVLLAVLFAVCVHCRLCPAVVLAQDVTSGGGLGQGERDTVRVDSRLEGREYQIEDSRINDQKIGYEERKIRLERRAEELLREEEVSREREERFAKEAEESRGEARRREAEDTQRKKRAAHVGPDL